MSSVILYCSENNEKEESVYGVLRCDFFFVWYFFICGWLDPQIQKKNCINFVGIWFWGGFFWVDRCPGVLGHTAMPLNLLWNPQTVYKVAAPFLHSPRKGWGLFLPLLTTLVAICLFHYDQPSEGDRTFSPSEPRGVLKGAPHSGENLVSPCVPRLTQAGCGWARTDQSLS